MSFVAPTDPSVALKELPKDFFPYGDKCKIARGIQSVLFHYKIQPEDVANIELEELYTKVDFKMADPDGDAAERKTYSKTIEPLFSKGIRRHRMLLACRRILSADPKAPVVAPKRKADEEATPPAKRGASDDPNPSSGQSSSGVKLPSGDSSGAKQSSGGPSSGVKQSGGEGSSKSAKVEALKPSTSATTVNAAGVKKAAAPVEGAGDPEDESDFLPSAEHDAVELVTLDDDDKPRASASNKKDLDSLFNDMTDEVCVGVCVCPLLAGVLGRSLNLAV